ncbi:unnamed protein product [Orchesella dallaii]|uniref:C2H2-type domain-containing protein n=1 Tax=Orchesella dallaii TaxID=48710 RepID=A0ABP1QUK1_9HEXA
MLEVVTAAEKVLSRTKLAKEKLQSRSAKESEKSIYEIILEFRKDFKKKCTRHLSTSLPRVLAKRIETANNDQNAINLDNVVLKADTTKNQTDHYDNLFLAWISTFVGVLWLGWSCWSLTPATTFTTPTFVGDELKIQAIYDDDEDDDICFTTTRSTSILQEESLRMDSPSNWQNTILEHENPQTVSVCHTTTSSDTCPSSWKDNLNLTSDAHVEFKEEPMLMIHPHATPPENVAVTVVPNASAKIITQFVCDLCQKGLISEASLVRHKQTVHVSRDQWPYYCCLCNRRYSTLCQLKRHNKSIGHNFTKSLAKVRGSKRNAHQTSRKFTSTQVVKTEVEETLKENAEVDNVFSKPRVPNVQLVSHEEVAQNPNTHDIEELGNSESSPQLVAASKTQSPSNVGLLRPRRHQKRKYYAEAEEESSSDPTSSSDSDEHDYGDESFEMDSGASESATTSGSSFEDPDFEYQRPRPRSKQSNVKPQELLVGTSCQEVASKKRVMIYSCNVGECKECFHNQETLDIHKKLHGEFLCKYCDHKESYAPDLAIHETIHYIFKRNRDGYFRANNIDDNTVPRFQCARCQYWCPTRTRYIQHHLKRHLRLSRKPQTCPVCKVFLTQRGLEDHIVGHHQIEGVDKASIQQCDQCSAYFLKEAQLLKHKMETHTNKPALSFASDSDSSSDSSTSSDPDTSDFDVSFNCIICSKTFLNATSLKKHEQKVHVPHPPAKSKPLRKRKRRQTTRLAGAKAKRVSSTRPDLKYNCEFAGCRRLKFYILENFEQHKQQHGTFPCSLCDFVETYAPKLALHELTHQDSWLEVTERNKPIRRRRINKKNSSNDGRAFPVLNCARCTFNTKKKSSYLRHHLEQHLDVPFKKKLCPICKRRLNSLSSLQIHTKEFHNIDGIPPEEVPRCDKCPAYFRKFIQLFSHEEKIHGADLLKCVDCGKRFKNHYCLKGHRVRKHKTNVSDFQFFCDVEGCMRRFETKYYLEWHKMKTHSAASDKHALICSKCGKKLLTVVSLKSHMRVHEENRDERIKLRRSEKNYVCDECGKAFKNKHVLAVHKLAHSGPSSWQYSCLVCEKKCVSEDKLYDHLRTHTNEKPYICQFCEEEYAHGHNLRNHMNKQHNANVVARKYDATYLESRKGKKLGRGGLIGKQRS